MRKNTWLELTTAIVFLIFVGIVLYYSFYPFKITTLESIGIDNAEYCRGDWVQVELKFIKHMDVQAQIKWYIVDGIVYELESPGVSRLPGDNHLLILKQIPYSILPGRYSLRMEATYLIHPLHKPIVNTWNTPTFEVLDASKCPSNPDENLSFPDPINKPEDQKSIIQEEEPTTIIIEKEDKSQTFTPEESPGIIESIMNSITKPVKGLSE